MRIIFFAQPFSLICSGYNIHTKYDMCFNVYMFRCVHM